MVRFGRQDGSPTLVELLHTVRQGPRLALFPRHFLLSQHSQHRRGSESQQEYTGRQCIVIEIKKRKFRAYLFTPVACTHETEHTSRTLMRVVVILLELSWYMRRLRTRSGTSFLRASGPVSRLRASSGTSCLWAFGPASRCVVSLRDGCLPLVLTWAYLAHLAARSSTCCSTSQRGPRLWQRFSLGSRSGGVRS